MAAENFQEAAVRHRDDANRLAAGERFQNAGHLIGVAAECLAKSVLQKAGITIDKDSPYYTHFPKLAEKIRQLGQGPAMHLLAPIVAKQDFLSGWGVGTRYDGNLPAPDAEAKYRVWRLDVDSLFNAAGQP